VIGLILEGEGYESDLPTGYRQPKRARVTLRLIFCVTPICCLILVWILSFFYNITREEHRKIVAKMYVDKVDDLPHIFFRKEEKAKVGGNSTGIINTSASDKGELGNSCGPLSIFLLTVNRLGRRGGIIKHCHL